MKNILLSGIAAVMFAVMLMLSGCGETSQAAGGSITAQEVIGPYGVRCFALLHEGQPFAGNCIPQ